jgi:hypothetical protein
MKANHLSRLGLTKDQQAWITGSAAIILVAGLSFSSGVFSKIEPVTAVIPAVTTTPMNTSATNFDEPIADATPIKSEPEDDNP